MKRIFYTKPTITDDNGPINFICFRQNFITANMELHGISLINPKTIIRNFTTGRKFFYEKKLGKK